MDAGDGFAEEPVAEPDSDDGADAADDGHAVGADALEGFRGEEDGEDRGEDGEREGDAVDFPWLFERGDGVREQEVRRDEAGGDADDNASEAEAADAVDDAGATDEVDSVSDGA